MESDEVMTKSSKSYTSLDDVSCGFSGLFSLTDPVRIEAVRQCTGVTMGVFGVVSSVGEK